MSKYGAGWDVIEFIRAQFPIRLYLPPGRCSEFGEMLVVRRWVCAGVFIRTSLFITIVLRGGLHRRSSILAQSTLDSAIFGNLAVVNRPARLVLACMERVLAVSIVEWWICDLGPLVIVIHSIHCQTRRGDKIAVA